MRKVPPCLAQVTGNATHLTVTSPESLNWYRASPQARGALPVIQLSLEKRILPVLLFAVAIFVWLRPQLGEQDIHPRMSRLKFDFIFAFGIGVYDGFLGPGTGTFLALAFMLGLGFNMARATASSKALNWASNVASRRSSCF